LDPKFATKLAELDRRLLERPGTLDAAIREAAASGGALPQALAGYVDTVRRHAYEVTDADIAALVAAGYSEDQIFELTIAAAYGAARARLQAGLDAMAAHPATDRSDT
jgi:alkylhydroperoxidase family enzyme